jgi:hypothetical protein
MLLFSPVSVLNLQDLKPAAPQSATNPALALKQEFEKKKSDLISPEAENTQTVQGANVSTSLSMETASPKADSVTSDSLKTGERSVTHHSIGHDPIAHSIENREVNKPFAGYAGIQDKWTQIVLSLSLEGPASIIARNGNFRKVSADEAVLVISNDYEMLASEQVKQLLRKKLAGFFDKDIKLQVEFGVPENPTPEMLFQQVDVERQALAKSKILEDSLACSLIEEFSAEIIEGSARLL